MKTVPEHYPIKTYSLHEVAALVLPVEWTDGVRWLSRRLNRGELSGYRVGRTWRMTRDDVEFLIAKHRNVMAADAGAEPSYPATAPVSFVDGLSERSRSRVKGRAKPSNGWKV